MKNAIFNIYKTLFFFDFAVIVMYLIPDIKKLNGPFLQLWREGLSLAVMLIFTGIFTRLVEKRKIKILFFKNKLRNFSMGLIIALLMTFIPLLLLRLFKMFSITGSNGTKHTIVWLIALLLNAAVSELLLRGYLFRLYRKYYNIPVVCIIISILTISLNINMFKSGITYALNMIAFNVLLCLITEYSHSITPAIALHFTYNVISSFLFSSFTVTKDYPHYFNTVFSGKAILSGGNMKLEGSVLLLIITVSICTFYFSKLKKRAKFSHY